MKCVLHQVILHVQALPVAQEAVLPVHLVRCNARLWVAVPQDAIPPAQQLQVQQAAQIISSQYNALIAQAVCIPTVQQHLSRIALQQLVQEVQEQHPVNLLWSHALQLAVCQQAAMRSVLPQQHVQMVHGGGISQAMTGNVAQQVPEALAAP